jgi:hypothetical protein
MNEKLRRTYVNPDLMNGMMKSLKHPPKKKLLRQSQAHRPNRYGKRRLSRNRPNYKSTSTKTITEVIKFPHLSPYNSGSPTKS